MKRNIPNQRQFPNDAHLMYSPMYTVSNSSRHLKPVAYSFSPHGSGRTL